MRYKVFLVEDEIVTREGIRDNVDWQALGFEFCGDAPDGEIALPALQSVKPDVLITDIRMPFMDGLELSQIVRDRMPTTKIIILSGHDEFEYAQKAIQLGVCEYLLKPVSVQDLQNVLQKVASKLDAEKGEQEALQKLQEQLAENRAALRERFLLRVVTGTTSFAEALEKCSALGIELLARCYQVVVMRLEAAVPSEQFDFVMYQSAQQLIFRIVEDNPLVFLLRKDVDELVLMIKGTSPEQLYEERDKILERAEQALKPTGCRLIVGSGAPQFRITDICRSFIQATNDLQATADSRRAAFTLDQAHLLQVEKSAVGDYLRSGAAEDFDKLFETLARPLGMEALKSPIVRALIFTDVVLAAARFVDERGGDVDQAIPEIDRLEAVLAEIENGEQLRQQTRTVLARALAFRDNQVLRQCAGIVKHAQEYILGHYMEPALSLNGVATQVNLSASYFSAVFSQEIGQTFKEYLTEIRLKKAKELLRTTSMKAFEVAYQVGYSDPHYFSHVFHKHTGLTPVEFRAQAG
jgi:two-component system response regulator YesN